MAQSAFDEAYTARKNKEFQNTPANWPGYKEIQARGGFEVTSPAPAVDFGSLWQGISSAANKIGQSIQSFGQPTPTPTLQSNIKGDPSQMKVTYGAGFLGADTPTPTTMPTPTSTPISTPTPTAQNKPIPQTVPQTTPQTTPQPIINDWTPKYADLYRPYIQQGVAPETVKLIVTSENGREDPNSVSPVNPNGTVDVGLMQVSVPKENIQEIERLKNPAYNVQRGMAIWNQRVQLLEDPILALASYNMGSGGAVLAPEQALQRAIKLYNDAGLQIPETEFTKNPLGYVRARMERYKKLGLFRA